jgi:hypothetical protein
LKLTLSAGCFLPDEDGAKDGDAEAEIGDKSNEDLPSDGVAATLSSARGLGEARGGIVPVEHGRGLVGGGAGSLLSEPAGDSHGAESRVPSQSQAAPSWLGPV